MMLSLHKHNMYLLVLRFDGQVLPGLGLRKRKKLDVAEW